MSSLSDDIRKLLKRYNIRPSKKRGQSFLSSHRVARDIVDIAELSKDDSVLEIGGGLGVLTQKIAEKAGKVYVIEVDSNLVQALQDTLKECTNITIIEGDALKVDLPKTNKIVANLPYSISSEITFRILREMKFQDAVLMYQKEFAARLVAKPGTPEYSRLTINVQYYARIEEVMEVSADLFYPVPMVDSMVVRMIPRVNGSYAKDDSIFHWMIGGIYPYPNKNLRKALRIWFRNIKLDKELPDELLSRLESVVKGDERLRSIGMEELVRMADVLLLLIEDGMIPDPRV
ncbi:MAG: 16S rRNA (adenine(1518)-N(6)/adenine(1519)-N(6))-dimethyltransferase RsmA [Candidatus Thorarchaeota archaeon]